MKESPPFRPPLEKHGLDASDVELTDLMRTCWEEIPAFRPNYYTIRDCIKKMNKGRSVRLNAFFKVVIKTTVGTAGLLISGVPGHSRSFSTLSVILHFLAVPCRFVPKTPSV